MIQKRDQQGGVQLKQIRLAVCAFEDCFSYCKGDRFLWEFGYGVPQQVSRSWPIQVTQLNLSDILADQWFPPSEHVQVFFRVERFTGSKRIGNLTRRRRRRRTPKIVCQELPGIKCAMQV